MTQYDRGDPQLNQTVIRFGAGMNTRASEDEINDREDNGGTNFALDLENTHFRPRKPFVQVGVAPNGKEIKGYAQLIKQDDTISTLIQAGDTVYEWDGTEDGFTSVTTVSASAQLRGTLQSNYTLDDKVIITDLTRNEEVKEWDGTTFQDIAHNLGGSFFARYCFVENERAFYGNVKSGTDTPHMLVGSKRGDFDNLSVANRPSSSLGDADPFFVLTPDLRPINGMVQAFGNIVLSSRRGNLYRIVGETAKNFAIIPFFSGSAATGEEGVTFVGNDVIYGKEGVIESLSGVETFGDVSIDDLSRPVADQLEDIKEWIIVYDRRLQRVYCFPDGTDEIWVFHKPLFDEIARQVSQRRSAVSISPWAKWTTQHSSTFQPSTAMNLLHPTDKTMRVYFGDSSGNLYQMDGDYNQGDGGSTNIKAERLTKLYPSPTGREWDIHGWITYRKDEAFTVTLRFEYGGISVTNQDIVLDIPAISGGSYYNASSHYNDGSVYNIPFRQRLVRREYAAAGRPSHFQVRATIEGTKQFSISEIGLRWTN